MAEAKHTRTARAAKAATAGEAAALNTVYEKLTDLLNALKDARMRVHNHQLLSLVNEQIDRQLEVDAQLRDAILEHTGKPVEDPY